MEERLEAVALRALAAAFAIGATMLALGGCGSSSPAAEPPRMKVPAQSPLVAKPPKGAEARPTHARLRSHRGDQEGSATLSVEDGVYSLTMRARRLPPTGGVENLQYAVWIAGPNAMELVGTYRVKADGLLRVAPVVLNGIKRQSLIDGAATELRVTGVKPPKFRAAMAQTTSAAGPGYTGAPVMAGPFVGPAIGPG